MAESEIIDKISEKGSDKEGLANAVIGDPRVIPELIEALNDRKGSIKFGCEKVLRLISERKPELIYPYFDNFVDLLDSDNKILKWGAIMTIANLAAVDSENKFEKIFEKYYSPVSGPVMITAANIIGSSAKIALARPDLVDRITEEILRVERAEYRIKGDVSPECLNIVYSHALTSFERFFDRINEKGPVIEFIKKQLHNPRKAVARKAEQFVKKRAV